MIDRIYLSNEFYLDRTRLVQVTGDGRDYRFVSRKEMRSKWKLRGSHLAANYIGGRSRIITHPKMWLYRIHPHTIEIGCQLFEGHEMKNIIAWLGKEKKK